MYKSWSGFAEAVYTACTMDSLVMWSKSDETCLKCKIGMSSINYKGIQQCILSLSAHMTPLYKISYWKQCIVGSASYLLLDETILSNCERLRAYLTQGVQISFRIAHWCQRAHLTWSDSHSLQGCQLTIIVPKWALLQNFLPCFVVGGQFHWATNNQVARSFFSQLRQNQPQSVALPRAKRAAFKSLNWSCNIVNYCWVYLSGPMPKCRLCHA